MIFYLCTFLSGYLSKVYKRFVNLSELRPISVTSILSRIAERLLVAKFIIHVIPCDQITYQFPSSLRTVLLALIFVNHHVAGLLEHNTYVRCFMVDYSKAFDTINHAILVQKLQVLVKEIIFLIELSTFKVTNSSNMPIT